MTTETRIYKVNEIWLCNEDGIIVEKIISNIKGDYIKSGLWWYTVEEWNDEAKVKLGTVKKYFFGLISIKKYE